VRQTILRLAHLNNFSGLCRRESFSSSLVPGLGQVDNGQEDAFIKKEIVECGFWISWFLLEKYVPN
jgi:hypothetical protein